MPKKTDFAKLKILQVRLPPDTRDMLESMICRDNKTMKSLVIEGIELVYAKRAAAQAEADAKRFATQ
jgi:hypothetical protein